MKQIIDRRSLLRGALRGAVGVAVTAAFGQSVLAQTLPTVPAAPVPPGRELALRHLHTGEMLDIRYHDGTAYIPDAMQAINRLMRDWRCNEIVEIDPGAIDILHQVRANIRDQGQDPGTCEIICGYRAPETNASLRARGGANSGVAEHSLHMEAEAIDMRFSGAPLRVVRDTARALNAGGVGMYSRSNFVHVDTGRPRFWGN